MIKQNELAPILFKYFREISGGKVNLELDLAEAQQILDEVYYYSDVAVTIIDNGQGWALQTRNVAFYTCTSSKEVLNFCRELLEMCLTHSPGVV